MNSEKKRIVFIVNPISGTSKKKGFDNIVDRCIDKDRFDCRIVRTEYAGHASEIAKQKAADGVDVVVAVGGDGAEMRVLVLLDAAKLARQCADEGTDICVAVGGDGTVNEVARSLTGTHTALGIVPCGSGNGLAHHLRLPMSMKGALSIINQGEVDAFDYGIINGHPFFCTCGMGFDAHVSLLFAQSGKRGLATYARMVLGEGMKYKPTPYEVTLEDANGEMQHCEAFLIACANAAQYGNNTYIAPGASMQDGLLDVIIIAPLKGIAAPVVLMELFTKTINSNPHVRHFHARRVHIRRPAEDAVHFDGDPLMMGPDIDVEIRPRELLAIVNPQGHEDKAQPGRMIRTLNKIIRH